VPRASSGSRSLGVSFSAVIRAQALGEFSVPERDLSCLLIDLDLEAERVRFTSDFTAASFFRTARSVSCPLGISLGEIGVRPRSARSRSFAISPTAVTMVGPIFVLSLCAQVSVAVSDCFACVLPQGLVFTNVFHFLLKRAGGLQFPQVSWP
jgi:hypothetical protein